MLIFLILLLATIGVINGDPENSNLIQGEKIVGGFTTTIEKHPYQLSLRYFNRHLCGASLIKANVALTAAHCTDGRVSFFMTIMAGSSFRDGQGQIVNVNKVCEHPQYFLRDFDVALLHLEPSLELNSAIQTIPLQSPGQSISTGTAATVTGWGVLNFGGKLAEQLQDVQVVKISQKDCRRSYPGRITSRMTCYGFPEGDKDSCQGDSGGPLVIDGRQVGIVSWGRGCALPGYPGVYTRVENSYIADHINYCINDNF